MGIWKVVRLALGEKFGYRFEGEGFYRECEEERKGGLDVSEVFSALQKVETSFYV